MRENGSASMQALGLLILIAVFTVAISTIFSSLIESVRDKKQAIDRETRALFALKTIISYLEESGADGVDSRSDLESVPQIPGLQIKVQDISSRFNPNLIRRAFIEQTALSAFFLPGVSASDLQARRPERGLSIDIIEAYGDLLDERALERWFTPYSYACVNTDDEFALERLFLESTGSAIEAKFFHNDIERQLKELRILSPQEFSFWYGVRGDLVSPMIGAIPTINVNYSDPFILETILSYPAYKVDRPSDIAARINSAADTIGITQTALVSLLDDAAKPQVLAWLGTMTAFWRITITIEDSQFRAIIRRAHFGTAAIKENSFVISEFSSAGAVNDRLR